MKSYQHILLAVDFTEISEEVARRAAILARHFNTDFTLLHVVENFSGDMSDHLFSIENGGRVQCVIDHNRLRLQQFSNRIQDISHPVLLVRIVKDNISHEIIKVAKEIKADLIVAGAREQSDTARLSDLTSHVLLGKAPCDVLVVKTATNGTKRAPVKKKHAQSNPSAKSDYLF